MGVPVVTCPGETFASRHSLSHLTNIGLTETITKDLTEYVCTAVGFSADLPRLAELRVRLRRGWLALPYAMLIASRVNSPAMRQVWREC